MAMKFFFADSHDYVDPGFDFEREEFSVGRRVQHDDVYPHEFFEQPPYDGMLVSRATVGDEKSKGKYTTAQSLRFRRGGARSFLRYDAARFGGVVMGDCGAFSYVAQENPPHQVPEMVSYYAECGFTHAVSIDHVVLSYNEALDGPSLWGDAVPPEWRRRYELTLRLAEEFRLYCAGHNAPFVPIGVAQGWSPRSYAEAVRRVVAMGYDYVAIGGMVPLQAPQIHRVLREVRDVAPDVKLHLFGFTKADNIAEFVPYNIESFDSTSPMLRAFKDGSKNYLGPNRWYTALRLPHADENPRFKKEILAGLKAHSHLRALEGAALGSLRLYAQSGAGIEEALEALAAYGAEFGKKVPAGAYRETLTDRPWQSCPCRVCRESGIEALIFRGSNRNRRRGFHNLWAFYRQLQHVRQAPPQAPPQDLPHSIQESQYAL